MRHQHSEMAEQYDFRDAERGKFYRAEAVFSVPIYLEPDVNEYMDALARKSGLDVQTLVNEWLRANIKLVESIQHLGSDAV